MEGALDPNGPAAADSGIFGLTAAPDDAAVVIVPVPFAATVSYGGGAERGPSAVLAASHQVDLYDRQFGRFYERGICLLEPDPAIAAAHAEARAAAAAVIDAGGAAAGSAAVAPVDAAGELVNARVRAAVDAILAREQVAGVLGGDHSVPFGAIAAAAERTPGLGILHFDAHADLRDAYEGFRWSHASIMANVLRDVPSVRRLVQVGIRDFCEQELDAIQAADGRVITHFDQDWQRRRFEGTTFAALCDEAVAALPEQVWISFDIDGLDPALCPGTGTPVPSGLQFAEAAHLLETLAKSGRRVVGFDLVEVAPAADGVGEWDANVGARLLYKLCGAALHSR
ncbi:MAG: agmatinase family protein [Planctomycetes bacterium]|nr:agmatinase family protein [Planctomycetota bacterium]